MAYEKTDARPSGPMTEGGSNPRFQSAVLAIKWTFAVLTIGYLAYFVVSNKHELSAISGLWERRGEKHWLPFALLACYVLSWLIAATQFYLPLRRINSNIGLLENVALIMGGSLLNYSPFKAGLIYRFYYLKRWHSISYPLLAGLQLSRIFLTVGVSGLIGLYGLSIGFDEAGQYGYILAGMFVLMAAIGIVPFLMPSELLERNTGLLSHLTNELARGIREMRSGAIMITSQLLLIGCQFCVLAVQYGIIFFMLGLKPSMFAYLMLIPFITLLGMISVTPGNLGLREIITASALSLGMLSFKSGMLVGLVDRGMLLAATIVCGGVSLLYLSIYRGLGRADAV